MTSKAAFPFFLLAAGSAASLATPAHAAAPSASGCTALAAHVAWPEAGTRLVSTAWHETGPLALPTPPGMPPAPAVVLPAHCEAIGVMHERVGSDGQHYAIRFHIRLPQDWNGKFFMQGGGGTNGELGDAVGRLSGGAAPALAQGYAVLSQDSGHDNAVNTVPAKGGASAFGFDPQARADYGGTSLPPTVSAAKAAIRAFYGRPARFSYFVGCSKGGQEGMMLATRYPALFDGIVAGAPGFALPRAAVAEMWDTQAFAGAAAAAGGPVTPQRFAQSFSAQDYALVRSAILAACDKDDGVADGIVGSFATCTSAKVQPELARVTCAGAKQTGCLAPAQVEALRRIHDGARNGKGEPLYAGFYWDAGWGDMGWQIWKTGGGPVPSLNVAMGTPSLAAIFTVPPVGLPDDMQGKLDYATKFDFDRDAPRIYATGGGFSRSAWQDIGARTPDLDAFRKRGGKLIVAHGASDPVFSLQDTADWYRALDQRNGGLAGMFARLFAVPGMGHCMGGPSTDGYDTFTALVKWVEHGSAPDRIEAKAGPASPWPGRTRPLCVFPKVARYKGAGSVEEADNFVCA
jgi:hypothetical protein